MADVVKKTLEKARKGVVVFSKSYCPFCKRAVQEIRKTGIKPVVVELDERSDGRKIQAALEKMTKQRTVPSVWIAGQHYGGCDDTLAGLRSGAFNQVPKSK